MAENRAVVFRGSIEAILQQYNEFMKAHDNVEGLGLDFLHVRTKKYKLRDELHAYSNKEQNIEDYEYIGIANFNEVDPKDLSRWKSGTGTM